MKIPMPRAAMRQRGVVLLFCLVILVILLAGGVAVVRSMHTSLSTAGNLAFRRDLVNQGERAVSAVLAKFATSGALATATTDVQAENFKATKLDTNAQGVPKALLDDTTFATVGKASNDITDSTAQVSIRYVIDRLCTSSGTATSTGCVQSSAAPSGGTAGPVPPPPPPTATVYRLSMRVSGPRDTQVFVQSTFTKPD
ncbi:pilus assembly PilX family protein [Variovorax sp. ZT5P49]|uniref:pilus assembly PilX family protein n=1 Tax=Variovorax sp. ZT5P49 TaxID=3443733 RepID=UPI003F48E1C4